MSSIVIARYLAEDGRSAPGDQSGTGSQWGGCMVNTMVVLAAPPQAGRSEISAAKRGTARVEKRRRSCSSTHGRERRSARAYCAKRCWTSECSLGAGGGLYSNTAGETRFIQGVREMVPAIEPVRAAAPYSAPHSRFDSDPPFFAAVAHLRRHL
jgi:hypothetical protein